jgi:mRNA-degrading endonuclease toxin of MazEF toxin-antitoxin module
MQSVSDLHSSAYVNEDGTRLVVVVINDSATTKKLSFQVDVGYNLVSTHQTDKVRNCEEIAEDVFLVPQSVRTVVFQR